MSRKFETVHFVRVEGCPRCGKNHRAVNFTEVSRYFVISPGSERMYKYYGRCPKTLAPIIASRDILNYQINRFI